MKFIGSKGESFEKYRLLYPKLNKTVILYFTLNKN